MDRYLCRLMSLALVSLILLVAIHAEAAVGFKWCGGTPALDWGLVANDQNQTFGQYQFEFSPQPTFADVTPVIVPGGKQPPMTSYPFLKYDVLYYVRVSVRRTEADPWSAPGSTCSFTPRNNLTFKWCNATPALNWGLVANEQNQTSAFQQYRFEFSPQPTFADVTPVIVPGGKQPPMTSYPFLKYDVLYYVRVSVRRTEADPWSAPGPACSFTPRTGLRFKWCGSVISPSHEMIADDGNQVASRYRFEFSNTADFATLVTAVEVVKGQRPLLQAYSQLLSRRIYYVRVRIQYRDGDPWSLPGPTCAIGTAPC